jgi:hypothetical protein
VPQGSTLTIEEMRHRKAMTFLITLVGSTGVRQIGHAIGAAELLRMQCFPVFQRMHCIVAIRAMHPARRCLTMRVERQKRVLCTRAADACRPLIADRQCRWTLRNVAASDGKGQHFRKVICRSHTSGQA